MKYVNPVLKLSFSITEHPVSCSCVQIYCMGWGEVVFFLAIHVFFHVQWNSEFLLDKILNKNIQYILYSAFISRVFNFANFKSLIHKIISAKILDDDISVIWAACVRKIISTKFPYWWKNRPTKYSAIRYVWPTMSNNDEDYTLTVPGSYLTPALVMARRWSVEDSDFGSTERQTSDWTRLLSVVFRADRV